MASSKYNPAATFTVTFFITFVLMASLSVLPLVFLPNFIAPPFSSLCPPGEEFLIDVVTYSQPGSVSKTPYFYCVSASGAQNNLSNGRVFIAIMVIAGGISLFIATFYSFIAWINKRQFGEEEPPAAETKIILGGLQDYFEGKGRSPAFTQARYIINGKPYDKSEDLPANVRAQFNQSLSILEDEDGDGIPDLLQKGRFTKMIDFLEKGGSETQLGKLKKLLDAEFITQEDYDNKKD
ncbi:MAG: hypothetical protein N2D54_05090, partial [Chloroflexota bacterium]